MHRARLPIAEPCHERFDGMRGRGAQRFCDRCRTQVYDLSQMTKVEAAAFLARREGQAVCVRYRTDAAGTIVFRPAPPVRPVLALAAIGLGLSGCMGWVQPETMESPEDAALHDDAEGWTIPYAEEDAGEQESTEVDDAAPDPAVPDVERDVTGQARIDPQVSDPDSGASAPAAGGEGCPVLSPGVDDGPLMGRIVQLPEGREQRSTKREWKREQRRQARQERRRRGR